MQEGEDDHKFCGLPFLNLPKPVGIDEAIALGGKTATKHGWLGHRQVVGNLRASVDTTIADSAIGADFLVFGHRVSGEVEDFIWFASFLLDSGRDVRWVCEEELHDNVFPFQFRCRGSDDGLDSMWLDAFHSAVLSLFDLLIFKGAHTLWLADLTTCYYSTNSLKSQSISKELKTQLKTLDYIGFGAPGVSPITWAV